MWNLYQLQAATGTRASSLVDIPEWTKRLMGFSDPWTALQFDMAVSWFGHYVEAKLNDYDDKTHQPRFSLQELLSTREENTNSFLEMLEAQGMVITRD